MNDSHRAREDLVWFGYRHSCAKCELLENESTINREINATILVRENGVWRIAAQAWDLETGASKIPARLAQRN
jgi:hypothetical protein